MLECLKRVDYIYDEMKKLEKLYGNLLVGKTPLALTIRFKKPNERIVKKYSLSTATLEQRDASGVVTESRDYAHLFVMQAITKEVLDEFLRDLKNDPDPFDLVQPKDYKKPAAQKVKKLTSRSKVLSHFPLSGRSYY